MTAVRHITRALTRPALSWLDAILFALLVLFAWQYHWAWWVRWPAFGAFGFLVAEEHDWLRHPKEPGS